jgi:hypothetical protein
MSHYKVYRLQIYNKMSLADDQDKNIYAGKAQGVC